MSDQEIDLSTLPEAQKKQLARMSADKFICDLVGVRLVNVGDGMATAQLVVAEEHLNGVGICQGGALFSLADYALAAAFNYTDESVVSLDVSISYCKSAKVGARLNAEAKETLRTRSTTLGDVVVKDQDGRIICLARGRGYVMQPR